jgi:hypothetical protein
MSTSFECPRCQHRFVDASDADQAFAECPQCGSLALPGAMVSSTDSRVLKSVSGQGMLSDEGLPTSDDADPTVAIPIPGVFSALLDADVNSDGGPAPSAGAQPLLFDDDKTMGGDLSSFEDGPPTTESDAGGGAKKLPMSLLLTRGVSAEGGPALDDDPSLPTLPSLPSLPNPLSARVQDGPPPMALSTEGTSPSLPRGVAPAPLLGDASSPSDEGAFRSETFDTLAAVMNSKAAGPSPERPPAGDRGGAVLSDLDLGDLDIDLNLAPPIHQAPAKRAPASRPAPARAPAPVPAGFDATDEGAAISDDRTTELRTTPSAEGRAVTLSELEARLGGGGLDVAQIFNSPGLIQEEAFGALEQAFDEVSRRPPSRPPKRDRVQALAAVAPPVDEISLITLRGGGDVPAPPAKPTVPTTKLRRRGELPHLSLSDEAIALAAYRIGETERSVPGRSAPTGLDTDDDMPAHLSEPTDLVRPHDPRQPLGATITDVHAAPRSARGKARLLEEESEKKSVFTAGRVFVLAIVMACAGGAVGAATAPPSPDDEPSARMNAIKQVAAGNRFFDEGRFDEALGAYRGALNSDRNYVQAHRAKAIALVKQRRYDEAAKAYEEYLAVSDDASDADLVKEILYRYNAGGETR